MYHENIKNSYVSDRAVAENRYIYFLAADIAGQ